MSLTRFCFVALALRLKVSPAIPTNNHYFVFFSCEIFYHSISLLFGSYLPHIRNAVRRCDKYAFYWKLLNVTGIQAKTYLQVIAYSTVPINYNCAKMGCNFLFLQNDFAASWAFCIRFCLYHKRFRSITCCLCNPIISSVVCKHMTLHKFSL